MLSLSCLKAPTLSLCPRVQARPFLTAFGALCGKWATHPVTPSPAHSRHPHTLSQPHWGCALFPRHSASGFGHVGPLTQHASRMPLHLFKSRSFLGAPQFRRRFCQEAFQVSPGGVTLSPSFLLSDRLCVALSYFFHSNVHSGEHVHFSSLCHTSCFGSQSLRTKVSGRHSRVPWA